jgi:threonyl-tRNA synthetase
MRFNLNYVDSDGSKKTPVVLHRAIFGSIDRTIAYYLEETKGVLPLWLAPTQINIIPVNLEYHLEYAKELQAFLMDNDFRVSVDDREEKLSYKMRESQTKKIPFTLIIGDKEKNSDSISYRLHGSQETVTVTKDEFVELLNNRIKEFK